MTDTVRRMLIVSMLALPSAASLAVGLADSGQSTRITESQKPVPVAGKDGGHRGKSDYVLKELDLKPGDVVVDIGAGDGWWSERMAKFVGESGMIHAADVDKKKVEQMEKRFARNAQIRPYLCPNDSPGLPEHSCDLAFFSESYHHLGEGKQIDYLKRLRSVIKPTGRVVIIERYTETGLGNGSHGTRLSRLIQQAEEAGWIPLRTELLTGTYRYLAIFAQKDLFPPEPARKKAGTRKKAAASVPDAACQGRLGVPTPI